VYVFTNRYKHYIVQNADQSTQRDWEFIIICVGGIAHSACEANEPPAERLPCASESNTQPHQIVNAVADALKQHLPQNRNPDCGPSRFVLYVPTRSRAGRRGPAPFEQYPI